MRHVLPWLCCLLLAIGSSPAQTTIHRCVAANGEPVFTDQPCAAMAATPAVPRPAAPGAGSAPAIRAPALLCPRDVDDLRQVVADAFATRDANRLAGIMWWQGHGGHAVVADIRALGTLVREPLLQVTTTPPWPGPDAAAAADATGVEAPPLGLALETPGIDDAGPHVTRFGVLQRAGCLWLRPGDDDAG